MLGRGEEGKEGLPLLRAAALGLRGLARTLLLRTRRVPRCGARRGGETEAEHAKKEVACSRGAARRHEGVTTHVAASQRRAGGGFSKQLHATSRATRIHIRRC